MKVVEVRAVACNWGPTNFVFVQVITDAGLTGVGECTLEGQERTVLGAVEDLAQLLVGQDPLRIGLACERWRHRSAWPGAPLLTAMSGLEQALWDIAGKAYGQPVYRLLGGAVRDRVPAYTWIGPADDPDALADAAARVVARGFRAVKFAPFAGRFTIAASAIAAVVRDVAAVRAAVGPDIGIALDLQQRLLPAEATRLARALEPADLLWLEEPVTSTGDEALARLRKRTRIRLASGERHLTRWGFWPLLRDGLVDVVQPDVCHVGGITELRAVAAMAEAAGVLVAPHNPNGPVARAATLQVAACIPNLLLVEVAEDRDLVGDLLVDAPVVLRDGYLELTDRPGLGVSLDLDAITARPPVFRDLQIPGPIVVTS